MAHAAATPDDPDTPDAALAQSLPFVGFLPLTADGDCTAQRPCSPAAHQTHTTLPLSRDYAMILRALDLLVGSKLALGAYGDDAQQQLHWHFLLSVHLGSFVPSASDFFPALLQAPSSYLYREHRWRKCQNGTRAIADAGTEPAANGSCLKRASAAQLPDVSSGLRRLDSTGSVAWRLFVFAPPLPLPVPSSEAQGQWYLLGEVDKITSVSPQRFVSIGVTLESAAPASTGTRTRTIARGSCLEWQMHGSPTEEVVVSAVAPDGTYLESRHSGGACPGGGAGGGHWCRICSGG